MALFASLSERLNHIFSKLTKRGKLTELEIRTAMREVRVALLEADVNLKVAKQFIAEVSRALKNLAKELKIPIIALSQLSRAVDARPDHKPVLSDLRESGSIEQDADVVMFIYRDEYYNPETTTKPQTAEIIIAKQRSGETGSVDLRWIGKYTKFADPEKHYKG